VAAAEQRMENEREFAQRAAEWKSVSQKAALTSSGDHAQQVQWLAAQLREMQMATLQMQTQMQAQMQRMAEQQTREMARVTEQQARREEELLKERLHLEALYRSAMSGHARQHAGPQQSGLTAVMACRSS
jgi:hypothetical protein